jgi:hypothetical protein
VADFHVEVIGPVTFHAWVSDDGAGSAKPGLQFFDSSTPTVQEVAGSGTADSADLVEYTVQADQSSGSNNAQPFLQVTGPTAAYGLITDDWAVTAPVTFEGTDHDKDSETVRVAENTGQADGMFIEAALNDAGALYVAAQPVHTNDRDHMVFVWVGGPHAASTLEIPWAKSTSQSVPRPVAGGELFALIREGQTSRFCTWNHWTGSEWDSIHDSDDASGIHTCASGSPGSPSEERMEGVLDLTQGWTGSWASPAEIPPVIGFAAAPWDTWDTEPKNPSNMWETHLAPPAVAIDGVIVPDEVAVWRRADLWAGLLEAYLP